MTTINVPVMMVGMVVKPPPRMKVVGYSRVSTDGQADDGVSLAAQEERLRQYAALYDLELVAIHVDAGLSAKSMDRPGLQAALAVLDAREAEGLLVAKLDRLTRSVADLAMMIDRYFAKDFSLFSVADSIDTRSASGRMVLNILASVGQAERETAGERTRAALAHLKAKGVKLGAAALGWSRSADVDEDGRRVVIQIEDERAAVERIVALHTKGLSLRQIALTLAEEGFRTKRGGQWRHSVIRKVLARAGVRPLTRA